MLVSDHSIKKILKSLKKKLTEDYQLINNDSLAPIV